MIAYDYYCKQRLLEAKRLKRPKSRFAEDDMLDALGAIHSAMGMVADIIDEAEEAHFDEFVQQLIGWGFDPRLFAPEPYLEEVKFNFAYQFVNIMDKLFIRVESYLHDIVAPVKKQEFHFIPAIARQFRALIEGWNGRHLLTKSR